MSAGPESSAVSVVVVTYDHPDEVRECLQALRQQTVSHEVVVVDNSASDAVAQLIDEEFGEVRFHRDGANDGYAGGNNRGIQHARGAAVLVLNPDTVPAPQALESMLVTLAKHPEALITAKLIGSDGLINACGNQMHRSGLVTCQGLGDAPSAWQGDVEVFLASGAAIMATSETWQRLGGFEASYFLYMEDADLSLRARLQGRTVWCSAEAEIVHHYALNMSAQKFYWLCRNRGLTLRRIFGRSTLRAHRGTVALTESLVMLYALRRGPRYVASWLRAQRWLQTNRRAIEDQAASIQRNRVGPDSLLTAWMTEHLPYDQLMAAGWMRNRIEQMMGLLFRVIAPVRGRSAVDDVGGSLSR